MKGFDTVIPAFYKPGSETQGSHLHSKQWSLVACFQGLLLNHHLPWEEPPPLPLGLTCLPGALVV